MRQDNLRQENLISKIRIQAIASHVETESLFKRFGIDELDWLEFLQDKNVSVAFNNEQIRKIASFLSMPAFAVHMHLGKLDLLDFISPDDWAAKGGHPSASRLNQALVKIEVDNLIPGGLPAEAYTCSDALKALIVCLYEQATTNDIFPVVKELSWIEGINRASYKAIKLPAPG